MSEPDPDYWYCDECGNPVDGPDDECCPEGANEPAWQEEVP